MFCRHHAVLALLAIAVLPADAATVAVRTGAITAISTFPISCGGCDTSFAVTWTQSAGNTYSGVTITATLRSTNGSAASGTAYLSNSLGAGAANVVPPAPCPRAPWNQVDVAPKKRINTDQARVCRRGLARHTARTRLILSHTGPELGRATEVGRQRLEAAGRDVTRGSRRRSR